MQPTLYIPHGGGPCFFMEWPGDPWKQLEAYLRALPTTLPERPRAILVISAHWERDLPTVTATPQPSLIYDYTGFPAHTYALRYDAPGSPALAQRVRDLLASAGIASASDERRGLDHGVFVPLKLIFPAADIPVVALSLQHGYDPQRHLAIGAALAPLRAEGVLILGSGMSYHNLGRIFDGHDDGAAAFDAWLNAAALAPADLRAAQFIDWERAPHARDAHPEEDHLVPLFVAAGAASDGAERDYHDVIYGKLISAFRFT
ncbi:MAG: dioxygenase [Candidatus Eremiobacteraeota bacterium]|uniref:Putative Extradiol ring-cleavage dioxygenase, class III enzyme, subunit B n=1 Tax=mine drainage metagenome TaxID=410659 RepID=E6PEF1_9ZZZZ|nr:dioxygenase [Candidatus Eremiobacteraeota bacterium]